MAQSQSHAITRAKERYGVDFDRSDIAAIAAIVKAGYAKQLTPDNPEMSIRYELTYLGRRYVIVFKHDCGVVMTFLPPDKGLHQPPRTPKRESKMVWRRGRRVRFAAHSTWS